MELYADIVCSGVGLDNLDARERLIKHTNHITKLLLRSRRGVAQTFDNTADNKTHNRQEEDCKEGQLPRNIEHQHKVTDNKERLAECHLKGVCDTELHSHNIRGNARDNIALALLGEVADIHIDNVVKHHITHTLQRSCAHTLNRIRAQISKEI